MLHPGCPQCPQRCSDGGQRRAAEVAPENVVEAHHAHVRRNLHAEAGQSPQQPDREQVIVSQHSDRGVKAEVFHARDAARHRRRVGTYPQAREAKKAARDKAAEKYAELTKPELQDELARREITKTGTVDELRERLTENDLESAAA